MVLKPVENCAYSHDSFVFAFHVPIVFKLFVRHLSLKMISNIIEILQVYQRFLAFVVCIIDIMYLLGITFTLGLFFGGQREVIFLNSPCDTIETHSISVISLHTHLPYYHTNREFT